jgi:hypothetical protein
MFGYLPCTQGKVTERWIEVSPVTTAPVYAQNPRKRTSPTECTSTVKSMLLLPVMFVWLCFWTMAALGSALCLLVTKPVDAWRSGQGSQLSHTYRYQIEVLLNCKQFAFCAWSSWGHILASASPV